jgi:hypothetical protein
VVDGGRAGVSAPVFEPLVAAGLALAVLYAGLALLAPRGRGGDAREVRFLARVAVAAYAGLVALVALAAALSRAFGG